MPAKQKRTTADSPQAEKGLAQCPPEPERNVNHWLTSRLTTYIRNMNGRGKGNLHDLVLRSVEKPLIEIVLKETRGNQAQASQMLGINRNTLRRKIKVLGIKVKRALP